VLPLLVQALITIFLLRLQHDGVTGVSRITFVSYVLTSLAGFAFIARNHRARPIAPIALFYFPVMFSLMFVEALYLDGTLYGNNF
jgi:hypothetical protein